MSSNVKGSGPKDDDSNETDPDDGKDPLTEENCLDVLETSGVLVALKSKGLRKW